MLRMPFERIKFAFEWFEFRSNGSNLHSNASDPIRVVRICIQKLQNPFEWFNFAFESLEFRSNWSILNSNPV